MSLMHIWVKWTYYSSIINLLAAVSFAATEGVKTVAEKRQPHADQSILASRLGLFAALNSNRSAANDATPQSANGPESRYGLTYAHPSVTKRNGDGDLRPYSNSNSRLSLQPSASRQRDIFEKYQNNERDRYVGSDRYLTPQFVKFKNDIEMETEKTHMKGLRMSKDASRPAAVVYDRANSFDKPRSESNWPAAAGDDSFQRPFYREPSDGGSYEESGSKSFPHSYQRLSSSSGPNEPYSFDDASFPSGSYFKSKSNPSDRRPYNFPSSFSSSTSSFDDDRSVNDDDRHRGNFPSLSSLSSFPKDFAGRQSPDDDEEEEEEEEEGEENDGKGKDRKNKGKGKGRRGKKPKAKDDDFEDGSRYTTDSGYNSPLNARSASNKYGSYSFDNSDETHGPYGEKRRAGFHYGDEAKRPFSIGSAAKSKTQQDDGFDANYEITPDPFLADESGEESEIPKGAPKGRIRQFSRQRAERLKPRTPTKRCVKKHKEMFTDDAFDEPDKRMTCMVCENLQTGGKYESCSYKTNPKQNNYAFENAASYRAHDGRNPTPSSTHGSGDRFKRDAADAESAEADYAEPASDARASKSRAAGPSLRADESIPENYSAFDDTNEELQDEELEEEDDEEMEEYKPQPPAYADERSCKQVIRDGATCMVCRNPETNGKYEQCSYANEPENDYEFAQSTSYDKKGGDRFKRAVNQSELLDDADDAAANVTSPAANSTNSTDNKNDSFKIPDEWKDLRDVEQNKIEQANRIFKSLNRVKKEKPSTKFLFDIEDDSYERQFLNLFPELNGGTEGSESILDELEASPLLDYKEDRSGSIGGGLLSKSGKSKFAEGGVDGFKRGGLRGGKSLLSDDDDDDEGSEMSKMMKEFKSKDRSACTKKMKDKMTCYVCNDKDGMKREECMYIMENEPKKATLSESAAPVDGDKAAAKPSKRETSEPKKTTRVRTYKRERRTENVTPSDKTDASESTRARRRPTTTTPAPQRVKRGKSAKKTRQDEPHDGVPEVDPQSPRGAFSDETKLIYDDKVGTRLPRFMVEKNEHEEEIDQFMDQF